jgi:hypothetical protein
MRELDDRYFLLLDQRAKVLRAEIAEEQRRWREYLALVAEEQRCRV